MSEDEVELAKQAKRIEELNGEIIKKDIRRQREERYKQNGNK